MEKINSMDINFNNSISVFEVVSTIGILGSFLYSWFINRQVKKSTDASNEIEIANRISYTLRETRVFKEKIMLSKDDKNLLPDLKLLYEEAYEDYLNAYNEACQYYFDGKIDKKRFVTRYFRDIERFIEEDQYYKNFNHNFRALRRFYDKTKGSV